jgi:hypothetical protein
MQDGGLIHPNCKERSRVFGPDMGPLEEVHVKYHCGMPSNPELYRLENLEAIKPLEALAAELEPKEAKRMYMALSKLYVEITFGKEPDAIKPNFRFLADRFIPLSQCLIIDTIQTCGSIYCGFPIWEGKALRAKNGEIYHLQCPEMIRFETGKGVGDVEEVHVRYSCPPPKDEYLERILCTPNINTLEAIFTKHGPEFARRAYLAVENLMEEKGIAGHDLEKLAKKYEKAT